MNKLTELKQKYRAARIRAKEMSLPQVCRSFLLMLLRLVTVLYLVAMVVVLPFYFSTETYYTEIGSNKSYFFRTIGFFVLRLFLHIFIYYLVFAMICWWQENKKRKGKFSILMNALLDSLSVTDKFTLVFTIGLSLSYYYTAYPESLYLGAQGWYMGFMPQLLLISSYFAISKLLTKDLAKWLAGAMLAASFVVFLLGLLNRYQINPLGMITSGPSFVSTIGNINWYCGYWSVLFPVGAGLFLFYEKQTQQSDKAFRIKRIMLALFISVGFATGLTQGSQSGILALAALLLLLGCLAIGDRRLGKRYLEMLLIFCVIMQALSLVQWVWPDRNQYVTAVYILITKTPLPWVLGAIIIILYLLLEREEKRLAAHPKGREPVYRGLRKAWFGFILLIILTGASYFFLLLINSIWHGSIGILSDHPFFVFNETWGSSRGGTWLAGIRTWLSQDTLHKVVGVGPDGMAAYIYNGSNENLLEAVQKQFGNNRLTNAHGEWITILANLGLLGLLGFAGMMVSGILRFIRIPRAEYHVKEQHFMQILCKACGIGLFCYCINNIFSFQQTMNVTQMFIILGLGEYLCRTKLGVHNRNSNL